MGSFNWQTSLKKYISYKQVEPSQAEHPEKTVRLPLAYKNFHYSNGCNIAPLATSEAYKYMQRVGITGYTQHSTMNVLYSCHLRCG